MKEEPIVLERILNAPVSKVWEAITNKDQMKEWYFDLQEFKAEVGFEFQFSANNEGKRYIHHCKIVESIPGKKLSYSWKYEGQPGDSLVTFELFQEENKTRVKLTHTGVETFPADLDPSYEKKNFVEGWTQIIGTLLKEYVEKSN